VGSFEVTYSALERTSISLLRVADHLRTSGTTVRAAGGVVTADDGTDRALGAAVERIGNGIEDVATVLDEAGAAVAAARVAYELADLGAVQPVDDDGIDWPGTGDSVTAALPRQPLTMAGAGAGS
jgi:hypothetical protein